MMGWWNDILARGMGLNGMLNYLYADYASCQHELCHIYSLYFGKNTTLGYLMLDSNMKLLDFEKKTKDTSILSV